VPYRTVQNYLSGKVSIPATFVSKCCDFLMVETDLVLRARVDLDMTTLFAAVKETVGPDVLDQLEARAGAVSFRPSSKAEALTGDALEASRLSTALHIAAALRDAYAARRAENALRGVGYVPSGEPARIPVGEDERNPGAIKVVQLGTARPRKAGGEVGQ